MGQPRKCVDVAIGLACAVWLVSLAGCAASTPSPDSAALKQNGVEFQSQQMRNARRRLIQMSRNG